MHSYTKDVGLCETTVLCNILCFPRDLYVRTYQVATVAQQSALQELPDAEAAWLYLSVGTKAFKNNLQTYSAENRKQQQINAMNGLKKEGWSAIWKRHDGGESTAIRPYRAS